jgi:hypothetical protein
MLQGVVFSCFLALDSIKLPHEQVCIVGKL